jgi:hypothetical protein
MANQTANLDAPYISQAQSQPEVVANSSFDVFDGALGSLLVQGMSDADYTLNTGSTPDEVTNYMAYKFTGTISADRNIIIPLDPLSSTFNKKLFAVWNNATSPFNLTLKTASGTGVAVTYSATAAYTLLYCDGTNVVSVGAGGGSSTLAGLSDVSISGPTNNQVLTYNSGAGKWENAAPGSGSSYTATRAWVAQAGATTYLDGIGFVLEKASSGDGAFANKAPTSTTPTAWSLNTTATSTSWSEFVETGTPITAGTFLSLQILARLEQTTTCRMWIGMAADGGTGSIFQSDQPSGEPLVMFRYSTNASDTNFQCICQSGTGTNHTTVDSGVAADTNYHVFKITLSGGVYTFWIDGVSVATISTNTPPTSTPMGTMVHIDNIATSNNMLVDVAYMTWSGTL